MANCELLILCGQLTCNENKTPLVYILHIYTVYCRLYKLLK